MSIETHIPVETPDGSVLYVKIFDEVFDSPREWTPARKILDALLRPPKPQPPISIDDIDWSATDGEHSWLAIPPYMVPEQRPRGVVQWVPNGVPAQIGATS